MNDGVGNQNLMIRFILKLNLDIKSSLVFHVGNKTYNYQSC